MATIRHLEAVVNEIEPAVSAKISLKKEYQMLLTTPGIGQVLGLTIMLEVGNIRRFKKGGELFFLLPLCREQKDFERQKERRKQQEKR